MGQQRSKLRATSMKFSRTLISILLVILPCLVQSEPQISQNCAGGSQCGQNNAGSPAGPVAQNCVGAACEQNNIGRRKREIMAEILADAVEAVGRQERSAPAGHHGHPADAQHQESPQHRGSSHLRRSADPQHISQNCAGSHCNQNNIAAGLGSAGHAGFSAGPGSAGHTGFSAGPGSAGHAGFSAGFFPYIAQNCVGSACNQNNVLGRRKREVLAHLIEEARKIAEEEVEAEEVVSRRKREGPDADDCVVGPSGEEVCSHGSYGSDGESSVQARGNQGPGLTGSNGNAGPVSAAGLAYDPAAEAYRQQVLAYQAWAQQQVENAKGQLGTA